MSARATDMTHDILAVTVRLRSQTPRRCGMYVWWIDGPKTTHPCHMCGRLICKTWQNLADAAAHCAAEKDLPQRNLAKRPRRKAGAAERKLRCDGDQGRTKTWKKVDRASLASAEGEIHKARSGKEMKEHPS